MGDLSADFAVKRTTPVTRGLALGALLAIGFAVFTWLVAGPLKEAQIDRRLNRDYPIDPVRDWLVLLDRVGQRAVCLPILALAVAWVALRHRKARPVLVALVGVLAVNLVVWILKLWLGRGQPGSNRPGFFIEGQAYPSGHAANIVMVYGLAVYLIAHYTLASRRTRHVLIGIVAGLMVLMTTVSVLLRWHWLTDLIGGYLVAGALLAVIVAVDAAVPYESRRLVVLPPHEISPQHRGPTHPDLDKADGVRQAAEQPRAAPDTEPPIASPAPGS